MNNRRNEYCGNIHRECGSKMYYKDEIKIEIQPMIYSRKIYCKKCNYENTIFEKEKNRKIQYDNYIIHLGVDTDNHQEYVYYYYIENNKLKDLGWFRNWEFYKDYDSCYKHAIETINKDINQEIVIYYPLADYPCYPDVGFYKGYKIKIYTYKSEERFEKDGWPYWRQTKPTEYSLIIYDANGKDCRAIHNEFLSFEECSNFGMIFIDNILTK